MAKIPINPKCSACESFIKATVDLTDDIEFGWMIEDEEFIEVLKEEEWYLDEKDQLFCPKHKKLAYRSY